MRRKITVISLLKLQYPGLFKIIFIKIFQSQLSSGRDPGRRVLNTYSSLPRPGRLVGWRYADCQELSSHTSSLLARRSQEGGQGGPEYANLIPWTPQPHHRPAVSPPPPPPPAVHYATLGRAPHTNRLVRTFIILRSGQTENRDPALVLTTTTVVTQRYHHLNFR